MKIRTKMFDNSRTDSESEDKDCDTRILAKNKLKVLTKKNKKRIASNEDNRKVAGRAKIRKHSTESSEESEGDDNLESPKKPKQNIAKLRRDTSAKRTRIKKKIQDESGNNDSENYGFSKIALKYKRSKPTKYADDLDSFDGSGVDDNPKSSKKSKQIYIKLKTKERLAKRTKTKRANLNDSYDSDSSSSKIPLKNKNPKISSDDLEISEDGRAADNVKPSKMSKQSYTKLKTKDNLAKRKKILDESDDSDSHSSDSKIVIKNQHSKQAKPAANLVNSEDTGSDNNFESSKKSKQSYIKLKEDKIVKRKNTKEIIQDESDYSETHSSDSEIAPKYKQSKLTKLPTDDNDYSESTSKDKKVKRLNRSKMPDIECDNVAVETSGIDKRSVRTKKVKYVYSSSDSDLMGKSGKFTDNSEGSGTDENLKSSKSKQNFTKLKIKEKLGKRTKTKKKFQDESDNSNSHSSDSKIAHKNKHSKPTKLPQDDDNDYLESTYQNRKVKQSKCSKMSGVESDDVVEETSKIKSLKRTKKVKYVYSSSDSDSNEESSKFSYNLHENQRLNASKREVKKAVCKKCGTTFSTHLQLMSHVRLMHFHKGLKCAICSEAFKQYQNYMNHMRSYHPEIDPYPCKYPKCELSFRTIKKLRTHEKAHFKYVCRYCKKGYAMQRHMFEHVNKIHL